MKMKFSISDQNGFTLIELISVMVILGVLASVAVTKFDVLSGNAAQRVLLEAVKELNARESLIWTDIKLSTTNWTNDGDVLLNVETNLGPAFVWTDGPDASGGTLSFEDQSIVLTRIPSTISSAGSWK